MAEELCSAFQETGFAYLVNHGIGPDLIKEVYCSLKPKQSMLLQNLHQAMEKSFEFFSLDEDLKEKLRKGPEYQVGQYCFPPKFTVVLECILTGLKLGSKYICI